MRIEFQGPVGRLEGLVDEPDESLRGLAIVCHPHPVHGGTMNNTLVYRTARALRAGGFATLRLNFRGVEESEGEHDGQGGEDEDARAALDWLVERYGSDLPVWAAGYSFGSRTVASLARSEPRIERVLLLAFPVNHYDLRFLTEVTQPVFAVFGAEDPFGTASDFARAFPELVGRVEVAEIQGAEHFFRGRTPLVEDAFREYVLEHAPA
ncbi:MAG: alpha/beta fold hydrolase [Planctomycetota bacterium]